MGQSCNCLLSYPKEARPSRNTHPAKKRKSMDNNKTDHYHLDKFRSGDDEHVRYAHDACDAQYHRLNTYSRHFTSDTDHTASDEESELSESPYDAEQLQLHRLITMAYIHEQISYEISLPLGVIELCRKYYFAMKPIRRKRVVFTSIVQLNLRIDEIPPFILNESIFFFKVNKNELLDAISATNKEESVPSMIDGKDSNSTVNTTTCSTVSSTTSLIQDLHPVLRKYLKKKYEENLLLIMDENNHWENISKQLMSMEDIWCDTLYRPLLLDDSHWIHNDELITKYDVDSDDIVEEIAYNELKYAPTMEILWQSNPTLIPMRNFDLTQYEAENGHNAQYIACFDFNQSRATLRVDDIQVTTASNADLVVLSMYNSGNDYSEISKTSYCDEMSYSTPLYDMRYDADLINYAMYNIPNMAPVHNCEQNSSSSSSGCNICHKYHVY